MPPASLDRRAIAVLVLVAFALVRFATE